MSSSEIRIKTSISETHAALEKLRTSIQLLQTAIDASYQAKNQFLPSPITPPPSITPAPNPTVPAAAAVQRSRRLALPLDSASPAPPASEIKREVIMDKGENSDGREIMETAPNLYSFPSITLPPNPIVPATPALERIHELMNPQFKEQTLPFPAPEIMREVIMGKRENSDGRKIMDTAPNLYSFPSPPPPSITLPPNPIVRATPAVERIDGLPWQLMYLQLNGHSAPPVSEIRSPPASEIRWEEIMDNGSIVKIMETVSFVFEVDDFSSHCCKGMDNLIESSPFGVGGYSFSIQVYPDGADLHSFIRGYTSLFIKNLSPKTAHLAVDVYHLNRYNQPMTTLRGLSSSFDRETYHQVVIVEPGAVHGVMHLYHRDCIAQKYGAEGSFKIKATIGIVSYHNHHPRPLPPHSSSCILFLVEGCLYYALESIITTRCPALLQDYPHPNHIVLIPDVESDVFKAVLWFLHNNRLHVIDRRAIEKEDKRNELFSRKLIEAADKFKLKDLRRRYQVLRYYGESEVMDCYFQIESKVKELWENLSGLPQKMKELIPQKMKAA